MPPLPACHSRSQIIPHRNRLSRSAAVACLMAVALIAGCNGSQSSGPAASGPAKAQPSSRADALQDQLIQSVADNLNRLEEFDNGQMLPQIRDRLNQWVHQQKGLSKWRRDPLVEMLPAELQELPATKSLDAEEYSAADMVGLQETVWLRDIARSARGNKLDDLSIAQRLFDWTVRNIQLVDGTPGASADGPIPRSISELLLMGRGTARDRAWIFLLLLRQQGLDGVMLALQNDKGETREWLPALVSDDQLYLFDPALGLPLPGPDGRPVATLAEVAADDALLRKLDLSTQRRYPVAASDLTNVVALVEASPLYLSRRMKQIETHLTGQYKLVMSTDPTRLAERLKAQPLVKQVSLWTQPYDVMRFQSQLKREDLPRVTRDLTVFQLVPFLSRGRALQFKGAFDGTKGAKTYYLNTRQSDRRLLESRAPDEVRHQWEVAKQDASYWLGLIALEQQKYPMAIDYLATRTLEASPNGPWSDGAHFNLALAYEADGQLEKAIDLLQSDNSPQKHGNRLRARRLKAQLSGGEKPSDDEPAED